MNKVRKQCLLVSVSEQTEEMHAYPFNKPLWSSVLRLVTSAFRCALFPSSRCNNLPLRTQMLFQVRELNASA